MYKQNRVLLPGAWIKDTFLHSVVIFSHTLRYKELCLVPKIQWWIRQASPCIKFLSEKMFLKCRRGDTGFEENQWWGRWMVWVKARKSSIFVQGLVNNLARGWGVCGRVVKDKDENVCHLLFSCKGNSLKMVTVHFWICFLISEAQEMVRFHVQQAPGVLVFPCFEFRSLFLIFGT